jgi:glutamate/tyrosine decarboxylase-like PLP-dependent enzyme
MDTEMNTDPAIGRTAAHRALDTAYGLSLAHLESLRDAPVGAKVDLAALRRRLAKPLRREGLPPEQVLAELATDVAGGLVGSAGGRFFGWVMGGALPAALGADWLTAAWDQNAAIYACAPAAAVVEEVVGSWLKELLGLPAHASFALVTGCQMAHTTCLAAARHALLAERGWDVEEKGLFGAPPLRLLSSAERHGTVERAVRLLGLGRGQIVDLATDDQGRLLPAALDEALQREPAAPTIVLLQAADLNIGAYDPFDVLIPLARNAGAWVHVDGAFGLWAAASPRYRSLLAGVEAADSWATDGHKWLNVPYDSGYAFVARPQAHRAAMTHRAAYLSHDAEARDQIDWTPEWSRRARGFPTYAALRQLGRDGLAEMIERSCRAARGLVAGIGSLPGAETGWHPTLNQGLVRFLDPRPGATAGDHDRWTDRVIAEIAAAGEAFFGGTTWRGRRMMRVSVCNWQTSEEDVERAVKSVARVLARMREPERLV